MAYEAAGRLKVARNREIMATIHIRFIHVEGAGLPPSFRHLGAFKP